MASHRKHTVTLGSLSLRQWARVSAVILGFIALVILGFAYTFCTYILTHVSYVLLVYVASVCKYQQSNCRNKEGYGQSP